MLRYVPALLSFALTVYCLLDAVQTDGSDMRNLPKVAWILLVVLFPVVGPVAWLLGGRPRRGATLHGGQPQRRSDPGGQGRTRPRGPDDDPDFLKGL